MFLFPSALAAGPIQLSQPAHEFGVSCGSAGEHVFVGSEKKKENREERGDAHKGGKGGQMWATHTHIAAYNPP